MLTHTNSTKILPARVVVFGAHGFIGCEVVEQLEQSSVNVLPVGRKEIDLLGENARAELLALLKPSDVVVFISARAPCRDLAMLRDNLIMVDVLCEAIKILPPSQVIYVSSDAVYKDSLLPISEDSCAEPSSLHGAMHLTREIAIRQSYSGPLTIVRPTLVYGLRDPHNGYGPNSFRRLAASGKSITLFGGGEEKRDHVDVEDVASLICQIIFMRSYGIINAVSGQVVSFREIADFIADHFFPRVPIIEMPRIGKMPHGGYRAFDNSALSNAFPNYAFKSWREGLKVINEKESSSINLGAI